jgi:hypothetical protein
MHRSVSRNEDVSLVPQVRGELNYIVGLRFVKNGAVWPDCVLDRIEPPLVTGSPPDASLAPLRYAKDHYLSHVGKSFHKQATTLCGLLIAACGRFAPSASRSRHSDAGTLTAQFDQPANVFLPPVTN